MPIYGRADARMHEVHETRQVHASAHRVRWVD